MRPAQGLGAPAASPRPRRLHAAGQAAVLVFAPLWILQWAQLASALDRHAPGVMSGRSALAYMATPLATLAVALAPPICIVS